MHWSASNVSYSATYVRNQPFARVYAVKITSAGNISDGNTSGKTQLYSSIGMVFAYAGGSASPAAAGAIVSNWNIYSVEYNGASSSITLNNGTPTVANIGNKNADGITLGSASGGGGFSGYFVAIADCTIDSRVDVVNYINNIYGIF